MSEQNRWTICVSDMTPRLSLRNVTKSFGGAPAVDGVSLDVGDGEVVCLLGPSGCGKSTLLRIAAGVEEVDHGEVWISGRCVCGDGRHEPPESRSVGLMFQDFALFPHLTVGDNVAFGMRRGLNGERKALIAGYLRRVGLGGYAEKYPHQLSGGEQQRVALARALAAQPRLMLMDEPFSGLDKRLRDEIRDETLSLLKEEGDSVLLVTHEPEEALRMADRIALMRGGRVAQIGAPHHIYNHPVDARAAAFFSDLNVIHGTVQSRQTDTPFGLFLTPGIVDAADVEIIIRPQHLKIDVDKGAPPAASHKTGVPARGQVERSRFLGSESLIEVRMDHDGSVLKATVPGAYLPAPGVGLWLSLRRDHCFVFPCETQTSVANPWEDGRDGRGKRQA